MTAKTCSCCEKTKPIKSFGVRSTGIPNQCRDCVNRKSRERDAAKRLAFEAERNRELHRLLCFPRPGKVAKNPILGD